MDILELEDDFFKNTQDYSALTGESKPEILGGEISGNVTAGQSINQTSVGTENYTLNNWYQLWVQKYPMSENPTELRRTLMLARKEFAKLATTRNIFIGKKPNKTALVALSQWNKELNAKLRSLLKSDVIGKPKFRNAEGDFDVVNDYFEMEEYSNLSGLGKFKKFKNPNIVRPQEIKVVPPPQQPQVEVYTPVPPIKSKGTPITPMGGVQPIFFGTKYRIIKNYDVPMDVADLAPKVGDIVEGNIQYKFGQSVLLYIIKFPDGTGRGINIPLDVLELVKIPKSNQLPKELPIGKPDLYNEYMNNWVQQYPFIKGKIDPRTQEEIDENFVRQMISDAVQTYNQLKSFSKSAMLNKAALKQHIINLRNFYKRRFPNLDLKPSRFRNADGDTNNDSSELINGLQF